MSSIIDRFRWRREIETRVYRSPGVYLDVHLYNCVADAQQLKRDLYVWLSDRLQPEDPRDIHILVTKAVGDKDDVTPAE